MNSIGDDCNELKKQYDACFNNWFSERFLKGETDDSVCAPIFKVYQECVKVSSSMKNPLWPHADNIITPTQRAMREQKIELREIETDYTTASEFDNNNNSSTTGNSGKSQGSQNKS